MPQRLERSSVEFYLGVAVTILTVALPMTWWLRALLLMAVAGLFADIVFRSPYTEKWSIKIKVATTVVIVALIGAAGWKQIWDDFRGTELPDVTIRLVDPKEPSLLLVNDTGVLAPEVRYQVAFFNLDEPVTLQAYLPIQSNKADYIRPHSVMGPNSLFTQFESKLKPGNRIFGSMSAMCSTCDRGRTYWVYIVWNQGGWFAEIPDQKDGSMPIPKGAPTYTEPYLSRLIAAIPRSLASRSKNETSKSPPVPRPPVPSRQYTREKTWPGT